MNPTAYQPDSFLDKIYLKLKIRDQDLKDMNTKISDLEKRLADAPSDHDPLVYGAAGSAASLGGKVLGASIVGISPAQTFFALLSAIFIGARTTITRSYEQDNQHKEFKAELKQLKIDYENKLDLRLKIDRHYRRDEHTAEAA